MDTHRHAMTRFHTNTPCVCIMDTPPTHTHSPPQDLQVGRRLLWKLYWGIPGPVGCAQRADLYPWGAPYPSGDVWGGKTGRSPREAVVPGTFARAHALERHLGSSGSVPCGWSTKGGFRDAGQGCSTWQACSDQSTMGTAPPFSITTTNKGRTTVAVSSPFSHLRYDRSEGEGPGCRKAPATQF